MKVALATPCVALALGACPSNGKTSPLLAACDNYYAAEYSRCGGPVLPPIENARQLGRFEQVCQNEAALPGSGVTTATLEACAEALDVSPCEFPAGPPLACNFHGSLPGGRSCADGIQCQSGSCSGTVSFTPGGPEGPYTCGKCEPVVPVGQVCNSAGCPADSACISADTATANPTYTCLAITQGDAGTPCNDLAAICQPGLYCAEQSATCQPLAGAGAPCGDLGDPGGCAAPLGCEGQPSTCVSSREGGPCFSDFDCVKGLGCVQGECAPVTWVGADQPCSASARCRVGSCIPTLLGDPSGTCPAIIPDGQPCTVQDLPICDAFSECFGQGTCTLIDSVSCE